MSWRFRKNDATSGRSEAFSFVLPFGFFSRRRNAMSLVSLASVRTPCAGHAESLTARVGGLEPRPTVWPSLPFKGEGRLNLRLIRIDIPLEEALTMPIHNVVRLRASASLFADDSSGVRFSAFMPKYLAAHTAFHVLDDERLVLYFRQNAGKGTTFTVRHLNVTDSWTKQAKLFLAWAASKLAFWIDPILLYEKNGRHYEESGRVVFERLVDEGCPNVRFVIDRGVANELDVDPRYRKRFLYQHTFAHYVRFFRCQTFLGTETAAHALELRCQNLFVQRKLKSRRSTHVFLQHGVMYMISLDSPQRTSFRRTNVKGRFLVVVSSHKEAQHFIDSADFSEEELIVCGLPKFDRSFMNDDADKILVMPTWRIWEFAEMREHPEKAAYTKMVAKIVSSIPESLRDKVVVAPHPLFDQATFAGSPGKAAVGSYDELLRGVRLLITDYSSIAFDAFYRGANVVFWWEEKDECMARYGEGTHLMIDEQSAFGPVCYSPDELEAAVVELYGKPQSREYAERFAEIVEHRDGHNTDRLLKELADKGVLNK